MRYDQFPASDFPDEAIRGNESCSGNSMLIVKLGW